MVPAELAASLEAILRQYGESFRGKQFGAEPSEVDDPMLVFGLTQAVKAGNRQYWGRELGMCWQRLVVALCKATCDTYGDAVREGADELCDLVVGKDAIDTKYRIGSGDSGTLKKFKAYGQTLSRRALEPVLLIVRTDNLPAAIAACETGGWRVLAGSDSFNYIQHVTGFDLHAWLIGQRGKFSTANPSQFLPPPDSN